MTQGVEAMTITDSKHFAVSSQLLAKHPPLKVASATMIRQGYEQLDSSLITEEMRATTDITLPSFFKKVLGLKSLSKKEFGLHRRHYSNIALISEEHSQIYYRNDKFMVGTEEG